MYKLHACIHVCLYVHVRTCREYTKSVNVHVHMCIEEFKESACELKYVPGRGNRLIEHRPIQCSP